MSKEDVVQAGVAKIGELVSQAYSEGVGVGYDGGFAEGVASVPAGTGGGFTQADIDAAVLAAQGVDAQALADAMTAKDAAYADLQSKFDALAVKEGQESGVISGLQDSLQKIKDAEALLAGLFPIPVPPPVDPAPPVEPDPQP